MRGVYFAKIACATRTAAGTLLTLTAPATCAIEILSAYISNSSYDTAEQNRACLQRASASGTGTALTPSKLENGDQASGATAKGEHTVEPSTYTANTEVNSMGFNNLGGYLYQPTPEERMVIPPSGHVGLRLLDALASTAVLEAGIMWREIG